MNDVEDFLEHFGVKGMHWGIRSKRRTKRETRTRAARQQLLNRRRQISDSDLKSFVDRLNNEKKLKTLVEEDLKPGRTYAKRLASSTGTKVVGTVAAGAAAIAIKFAVERKLTPKFDAEGKRIKIKLEPKSTADLLIRGGKPKK